MRYITLQQYWQLHWQCSATLRYLPLISGLRQLYVLSWRSRDIRRHRARFRKGKIDSYPGRGLHIFHEENCKENLLLRHFLLTYFCSDSLYLKTYCFTACNYVFSPFSVARPGEPPLLKAAQRPPMSESGSQRRQAKTGCCRDGHSRMTSFSEIHCARIFIVLQYFNF